MEDLSPSNLVSKEKALSFWQGILETPSFYFRDSSFASVNVGYAMWKGDTDRIMRDRKLIEAVSIYRDPYERRRAARLLLEAAYKRCEILNDEYIIDRLGYMLRKEAKSDDSDLLYYVFSLADQTDIKQTFRESLDTILKYDNDKACGVAYSLTLADTENLKKKIRIAFGFEETMQKMNKFTVSAGAILHSKWVKSSFPSAGSKVAADSILNIDPYNIKMKRDEIVDLRASREEAAECYSIFVLNLAKYYSYKPDFLLAMDSVDRAGIKTTVELDRITTIFREFSSSLDVSRFFQMLARTGKDLLFWLDNDQISGLVKNNLDSLMTDKTKIPYAQIYLENVDRYAKKS
ncbi:hypothetical protein M1293_03875 [Candidatus Parvarchaeota archaeon]|nr:hypothetical protein [Candidatus Parvarchaeota archaeon]